MRTLVAMKQNNARLAYANTLNSVRPYSVPVVAEISVEDMGFTADLGHIKTDGRLRRRT